MSEKRTADKKVVLGGYEIVAEVGRGAMGVVYKARQLSMDRVVAIKILPRKLAAKEHLRKRFIREARAAGKLSHPNLVAVHDVGQADGHYFIAMEYIAGASAMTILKKRGPFSEQALRRLAKETAAALQAAHTHGIIHRDVKPDNILLERNGGARLADLGLAGVEQEGIKEAFKSNAAETAEASGLSDEGNLTMAGTALGTPHYMSPEQVRGEKADARSDLYGLGSTLYTLAAGRTPFKGNNNVEIMRQVTTATPPPLRETAPRLSPAFAAVIEKLMAKKRAERFAAAAELLKTLAALPAPGAAPTTAKERPVKAGGTGKAKKLRRRPVLAPRPASSGAAPILVAAGVLLAAALAAVLFSGGANNHGVSAGGKRTRTGKTGKETIVEKTIGDLAGKKPDDATPPAAKKQQRALRLQEWERRLENDPAAAAESLVKYLAEHPASPQAGEVKQLLKKARQSAEERRRAWETAREKANAKLLEKRWAAALEVLSAYLAEHGKEKGAAEARALLAETRLKLEAAAAKGAHAVQVAAEAGNFAQARAALETLTLQVGEKDVRRIRAAKLLADAEKELTRAETLAVDKTVAEVRASLCGEKGTPGFEFDKAAKRFEAVAKEMKGPAARHRANTWAANLRRAGTRWRSACATAAKQRPAVVLEHWGALSNTAVLSVDAGGVKVSQRGRNGVALVPWREVSGRQAARLARALLPKNPTSEETAAAGLLAFFWKDRPLAVESLEQAVKQAPSLREVVEEPLKLARAELEREAAKTFTAAKEAQKRGDAKTLRDCLATLAGELNLAKFTAAHAAEIVVLNDWLQNQRKKTSKVAEKPADKARADAAARQETVAALRRLGWHTITGDWKNAGGNASVWHVNNGTLEAPLLNAAVSLRCFVEAEKKGQKPPTVEVYVRYRAERGGRPLFGGRFGARLETGDGYGVRLRGKELSAFGAVKVPPIFRHRRGRRGRRGQASSFTVPVRLRQVNVRTGREISLVVSVVGNQLSVSVDGRALVNGAFPSLAGDRAVIIKVKGEARLTSPQVRGR